MLLLTLALALLVGVTLGLMGGGGSILMVPLLVYVARLAPGTAIAASLFVIGVTAIAAVLPHARGGRVQWRAGAVLGVAAMAGAYAGGRLAEYVPEWLLLATFALLMLATAIAMIRGRRDETGEAASGALAVGPVLLAGVGVGLLTGFVGAGGGFLIVPALTLFARLPMRQAIGTSLLVIAMNSFAGLAGHLASVSVPWATVLAVTAAAVVGSVVGGRLTGRVHPAHLRRGFGWFVLAMGLCVLTETVLTHA